MKLKKFSIPLFLLAFGLPVCAWGVQRHGYSRYTFTINFINEDPSRGTVKSGYESIQETEEINKDDDLLFAYGSTDGGWWYFYPSLSVIKPALQDESLFIPAKGYKYVGLAFDTSHFSTWYFDRSTSTETLQAFDDFAPRSPNAIIQYYSEDGTQYGHRYFISKESVLQYFEDISGKWQFDMSSSDNTVFEPVTTSASSGTFPQLVMHQTNTLDYAETFYPVFEKMPVVLEEVAESDELTLSVDTRTNRTAEKGVAQNFAYSLTAWGATAEQGAATVTYTHNGGPSQTLGSYTPAIAETATWLPEKSGTYVFTHQPGGLTATFAVPQKPTITVESVRQQYPFNKVNVQYLIDDLDPSATYSVALKSVVDGITNAVNIADLPATEGSHKVTFDAANAEVAPGLQNIKKKIKLVGELYAE